MTNFKLRRPSQQLWYVGEDGKRAWTEDLLTLVARVKPEEVVGFRIQINLKERERQA